MFLLDTNAVSELMKPKMDRGFSRWLDRQDFSSFYLSTPTLAELGFGIAQLPEGKRKEALKKNLSATIALFKGRVLSFNQRAASSYVELALRAKARGRGFPMPDSYIAAIAVANDFTVVTRDTSPFEAADAPFVTPWENE
ncbi:plasmid stability protein StbB [Betaproteobacteria bacterium]|nr:plasmid stability protein StbB [Betaproteobacteria bacterium]